MIKKLKPFFNAMGQILAIILVLTYIVLMTNAIWPHIIPANWTIFLNVLNALRQYGGIVLMLIVGFEAVAARNWLFRVIYLLLAAVVVVFCFFPTVYDQLIAYIPAA